MKKGDKLIIIGTEAMGIEYHNFHFGTEVELVGASSILNEGSIVRGKHHETGMMVDQDVCNEHLMPKPCEER